VPAIAELGIRVVPTWANFLFCDTGEPSGPLCQALQQEGVIVRPMSSPWQAPNAFRVSIGTPEQNSQFLEALGRVRARIPELKDSRVEVRSYDDATGQPQSAVAACDETVAD
jgi:hypothetical protein